MGLPQEQPGGKQGGTENQGLGTFTAVVVVMFMGVGRLRMVVLVGMFGMVMVVMMMLVVIVATAAIFAVFVMVMFVVMMVMHWVYPPFPFSGIISAKKTSVKTFISAAISPGRACGAMGNCV